MIQRRIAAFLVIRNPASTRGRKLRTRKGTTHRRMKIETLGRRQLLVSFLSLSSEPVAEDAQSVEFTIGLSQPVNVPVKTFFSTRDGTAVGGVNYEPVDRRPVTIPAGDTSMTVTVPLKDSFQYHDLTFDGVITGVESEGRPVFHELNRLTNLQALEGRNISREFVITGDGQTVVFMAHVDRFDGQRLYSVPVSGGPITPLSPASQPNELLRFEVTGDNRVVYSQGGSTNTQLFSVPATGGTPVRLSQPRPSLTNGEGVESFQISPDGKTVVFAGNGLDGPSQLYSVPTEGGDPVLLSDPNRDSSRGPTRKFLITNDGNSVIFLSPYVGLLKIPIGGGPAFRLSGEESSLGEVEDVQFSPDGKTLVYTFYHVRGSRTQLLSVPLAGGTPVSLTEVIDGGRNALSPKISPDGSLVVYSYKPDIATPRNIFSIPIAGGTTTQLNGPLDDYNNVNRFEISPDGRTVLFESEQERPHRDELYAVPIGGGTARKLNIETNRTVGGVDESTFARNGDHVFYLTDNSSLGRDQLYRVSVGGGDSVRLNGSLTHNGVVYDYLESDGQWLLYWAIQETIGVNEIFVVPSVGGIATKINGPLVDGGDAGPYWVGPANSLLYVADQEVDGQVELYARTATITTVTIVDDGVIVHDFGDAPAPFPVAAEDSGPSHALGSLFLGSGVDHEADGSNSSAAGGDGSDDDGIQWISDVVVVEGSIGSGSFVANSSESGKLDAWIDFDGDRTWNDGTEQIATSFDLSPGANTILFEIPDGSEAGELGARFRLSREGGLTPFGQADSGEVEDYLVSILDGATTTSLQVDLVGESATLVEENGRLIVQNESGILLDLSSEASGSIVLVAPSSESSITVDLTDANTLLTRGIAIRGVDRNRVRLVGDAEMSLGIDHGLMLENVSVVDLTHSSATRLTLRTGAISEITPPTGNLMIVAGLEDSLAFDDADNWRMGDETRFDGRLIQTITNVISGETLEVEYLEPWHNLIQSSDVNNDGAVTSIDALMIINEIHRRQYSSRFTAELSRQFNPRPRIYFDQNADGMVTTIDAIRLINVLARRHESESERVSVLSLPESLGFATNPISISQDDDEERILLDGTHRHLP